MLEISELYVGGICIPVIALAECLLERDVNHVVGVEAFLAATLLDFGKVRFELFHFLRHVRFGGNLNEGQNISVAVAAANVPFVDVEQLRNVLFLRFDSFF